MKVVIFCGGKGTRIREETEFKPKPMVLVGERPIMWHIMKRYAQYGHKEFILPLGYKGDVIKQYFADYKTRNSDFTINLGSGDITMHEKVDKVDWDITLTDTGEDTEKGGRLARVARHLDGESFMATYGDGVADIDIDALLKFHKSHGKIVTFTGVRMPSRFGTVNTDAKGNVTTWLEKPMLNQYTNCGFFVFEPEIMDYLTEDESCDLEKEPMERLAKDGELAMFQHNGFWQCMDTLRDYQLLNSMWNEGNTPWTK